MLVKNLKISEIFVLEKIKRYKSGEAKMQTSFVGFAVVKPKNGIMVSDVLDKNENYKIIEASMDTVGTKYAPTKLHDPLSKYTNKKIITKKGIRKILTQKKQGLL